jgi:hypothetical protein
VERQKIYGTTNTKNRSGSLAGRPIGHGRHCAVANSEKLEGAKQMKPLQLSKELSLPIDAVTQTFAFLGRRGSGKTYGAGKLAELMLDAGAQIVVLDPIGVWYGLRLSADGKHKGFSVPVFGGEQGDVPLEPQAGALIAKLLVEERFSAVLDVSTFRKEQRKQFVTDFAEELMHRKKTNRSAIHVFFEESQLFVPQMVGAKDARMVGSVRGPDQTRTELWHWRIAYLSASSVGQQGCSQSNRVPSGLSNDRTAGAENHRRMDLGQRYLTRISPTCCRA